MKWMVLVAFHLAMLALASTGFTVVTGWGSGAWEWSYARFAYANGWGYVYKSDYTLAVVLTYMGAYAVGCVAYAGLWRRYPIAAGLSLVLCGMGLVTFGVEVTHWVMEHHVSVIASCPALLGVSGVYVIVREIWARRKEAGERRAQRAMA